MERQPVTFVNPVSRAFTLKCFTDFFDKTYSVEVAGTKAVAAAYA